MNSVRSRFTAASTARTEPNVFRDYFLGRMRDVVGHDKAGRHFVAVTDPGSERTMTRALSRNAVTSRPIAAAGTSPKAESTE
jgi:hypothetical protein